MTATDALRYNEQRNAASQDLAELRARESIAVVRTACCPTFTSAMLIRLPSLECLCRRSP